MTEDWLDYWNRDNSVYASFRHLEAHYDRLFADISRLMPAPPFKLLDYGCGDALMAPRLASLGADVFLFDGAAAVRDRLRARYADSQGIRLLDDLAPDVGPFDAILLVSVVQYLDRKATPTLFRNLRQAVAPDGFLLVADIVPPGTAVFRDAWSLLRFGLANGFLADAAIGLMRTLFSPYRRLRGQLGLTTYRIEEMTALLAESGWRAEPLARNIGPSAHRRSLLAKPA
ncbi:MAG: class I SAM-dependent methyltransferase [Magnetospirillum sp. WYHS-4]